MRTLNELQLGLNISLGRTSDEANASEDSPEWEFLKELENATSLLVRDHPCSTYFMDDFKSQGRFEVCQADPELEVEGDNVCAQLWIAVNGDFKDALSPENVRTLVGLVMGEAQKIQAANGGPEPKLIGLRKYEIWTESSYTPVPMPDVAAPPAA